jgi:hypothetical protein
MDSATAQKVIREVGRALFLEDLAEPFAMARSSKDPVATEISDFHNDLVRTRRFLLTAVLFPRVVVLVVLVVTVVAVLGAATCLR